MIYYSPHRKAHRRRLPFRLCRTTVTVQLLLLLTVSLIVCGLLEMSDMGVSLLSSSGQKLMDIHADPPASGGDGMEETHEKKYTYTYETLPGFFQQDDPATDAAKFDFMASNFGLIERAYETDKNLGEAAKGMTQWERFEHYLSTLNFDAQEAVHRRKRSKRHGSGASPSTRYILFFLGRHGNGYHNIAERYYGNIAWDCHFSALDGDPNGVMSWGDAHLSAEGRRQAKEVNTFWKNQTSEEGDGQRMSLPQLYLVSPLDRTLETAKLSFGGLGTKHGELDAVVMEKTREGTGIHTCDRRSTVSYIKEHYPSYNVDRDPNLSEEDEFWTAERREPEEALTQRLRSFFDDLFDSSDGADGEGILGPETERVSITSHSGAIGAMMRVLGHRQFSLGTGAVVPVLVKAQRSPRDDGNKLGKRNGGSGEGKNHKEPTLDLPDLVDAESDPSDKSKWESIPSCPADMDLDTVGQKRWDMSLKEFLDGVENGTVSMEEVAFRFTG